MSVTAGGPCIIYVVVAVPKGRRNPLWKRRRKRCALAPYKCTSAAEVEIGEVCGRSVGEGKICWSMCGRRKTFCTETRLSAANEVSSIGRTERTTCNSLPCTAFPMQQLAVQQFNRKHLLVYRGKCSCSTVGSPRYTRRIDSPRWGVYSPGVPCSAKECPGSSTPPALAFGAAAAPS